MANRTVNSDRFFENFAAGLAESASAGIATRTGAKRAGGTAFTQSLLPYVPSSSAAIVAASRSFSLVAATTASACFTW